MALDGLSNQSVGIYRTKDSSEKTEKMAKHYKDKAEFTITNIDASENVEKVDPDKKHDKNNNDDATKALILSKAAKLVEDENETEVLQVVLDNGDETQELTYTMQFNSSTKMIEMKNDKTNELIETIKPEELMKVLSKAKSISGILIDREI